MTNPSAMAAFSATLNAWGNIALVTDLVPEDVPYRHGGGYGCRWDADTGLTFMRARWYGAGLQRFVSRDQVRGSNRYWYANANPLLYIDPSGNAPILIKEHLGGTELDIQVAIDAPPAIAVFDYKATIFKQVLKNGKPVAWLPISQVSGVGSAAPMTLTNLCSLRVKFDPSRRKPNDNFFLSPGDTYKFRFEILPPVTTSPPEWHADALRWESYSRIAPSGRDTWTVVKGYSKPNLPELPLPGGIPQQYRTDQPGSYDSKCGCGVSS